MLKMDLYRMIKSISTWVILIAMILLFIIYLYSVKTKQNTSQATETEINSNESNVYINEDKNILDYYVHIVQGNVVAFFSVIFCAIFFSKEFSTGYIKNYLGKFSHKYNFVMSKSLIIAIFNMLLLITMLLISIILGKFLFDCNQFGSLKQFFVFSIVQYILLFALSNIILFLTILIKNVVLPLIIGLGYTSFIADIIYALINYLVRKYIVHNNTFDIGKYLIIGNLFIINVNLKASYYIRALCVAFIFIIITFIADILLLQKKDII